MRRPVGVKMTLLLDKVFLAPRRPVAILPSAVIDERFARCKLGVLVSGGAANPFVYFKVGT